MNDKDQWNGLIYRAMTEKLDWDRSADEYLRVFGSLLGKYKDGGVSSIFLLRRDIMSILDKSQRVC